MRRGSRLGAAAVGVLAVLVVLRRTLPAAALRHPRPRASAAASTTSAPRSVSVARVVDGDTILLDDGERVRILGIDAPETHDADASVRAVATRATEELAALVSGGHVALVPHDPARDRYGRLLAYVETTTNGRRVDVGAALLEQGLATTYPAAHPRAVAYMALARAARDRGIGLWEPEPRHALGLVPAASPPVGEAGAHVGETCRVEGTWHSERRTPTVQAAHLVDGGASLGLVLFPARYDEFPLEMLGTWEGRRVAVLGRIETYRGEPQIKLEDPFQVEPLDATR
jgi:micrococcal nuclease